MDEIKRLIAQFEAAVATYDRHIPHANGKWLERLKFHRDWDLRVISDLQQYVVNA
jgi:hypothetical protein